MCVLPMRSCVLCGRPRGLYGGVCSVGVCGDSPAGVDALCGADVREKLVHVKPSVAKTQQVSNVHIESTLAAWLALDGVRGAVDQAGEMTAEEYLAEQARKAAAEAVPNLFTMEMVRADMTPEMEEIKAAAVDVLRSVRGGDVPGVDEVEPLA